MKPENKNYPQYIVSIALPCERFKREIITKEKKRNLGHSLEKNKTVSGRNRTFLLVIIHVEFFLLRNLTGK